MAGERNQKANSFLPSSLNYLLLVTVLLEQSRGFNPPGSFVSGIRSKVTWNKLVPTTRKMTSQSQQGNPTLENLLKGILD